MKKTFLLVLLAALATALPVAGQTVADRLRELDRLRAEGLISEAVYDQQWKQVIADAMRAPGAGAAAPGPVTVPRLGFRAPDPRFELSFSGSWLSLDASDSDVEMLAVDVSCGYFATDRLQVVFGLTHLNADLDGNDLDATGVAVGVDYHFSRGRGPGAIVPYAGAGLSWMDVDVEGVGDDSDWAWEVRGGFKQYFGDRVVIKYQAAYQSFDSLDLDGLAVSVGVGLRF